MRRNRLRGQENRTLRKKSAKRSIEAITAKLSTVYWKNTPGTVLEEDQATVRGIHEDPTENGFLDKISKNALIVEPAMQLLGSQVYIHQ